MMTTMEPFDDGIHSGVTELVIRYYSWVDYIQIKYQDGNESSSWSERHGCQKAYCPNAITTTIKLDYPDELLTGVCGFYKKPWFSTSETFIRSITFTSNKRIFGPFGDEEGEYFSRTGTGSMIVGFHGCAETTFGALREIGVHVKLLNSYHIHRPKDLLPANDSSQINRKKAADNKTNNHSIDKNKISRIQGNDNGNITSGNNYFYFPKFFLLHNWQITPISNCQDSNPNVRVPQLEALSNLTSGRCQDSNPNVSVPQLKAPSNLTSGSSLINIIRARLLTRNGIENEWD